MLYRMVQQGQVDAMIEDGLGLDDVLSKKFASILQSTNVSEDPTPTLDPLDLAEFLKNAPQFTPNEYNNLLDYLHRTGQQYRAFHNIPHPPNAHILPPYAKRPLVLKHDGRTFSCRHSHEGNSAVQFYNPLTTAHDTGFIESIWTVPLENVLHSFIVIRPHLPLSNLKEGQAPFQYYPGFMTRILDVQPADYLLIIEPAHIVTHLTTYKRPLGTYGILEETLIVCWALNRGRR
jgi:hypothetical protein